jgi:DNA-binding NtrC family response regulator
MLKLLIVDDDPGVREGLALGLSDSFEVGQSSGGSDALKRLESEHPDVILLDQNMAGLSGTSLLESIGGHSGGPAVVMFSATMDVSLVRRALKLGAQDCVAKPFSLEELRGKLESAARSRVAPGGARTPFTVRVVDLLSQVAGPEGGSDLDKRRREFARGLMNEALIDTEGDFERAAARLAMPLEEFKASLQNLNRGHAAHGR